MQIGIAVLCLILSGIGLVFGGFTAMGQAMNTAMSLIGGVATIGNAITTIGERINSFLYKDKIANSRRHDVRLTQIKHRRQDLMDIVEESPDRLEQLFDSLARNLDFLDEINSSYQRAWV
jgi:hypothetical protein